MRSRFESRLSYHLRESRAKFEATSYLPGKNDFSIRTPFASDASPIVVGWLVN